MTRLHFVKKARKTIRGTGIKKGDSYYWWRFRRCPKQYSKTRPRRSQLTRSAYQAELWDLEDGLKGDDAETLASACEAAADRLDEIAEEQRGNKENMPESLQNGPTGDLLDERAQACEDIAEELRSAADELREIEEKCGENGEVEEDLESKMDEVMSTVDWSR